MHCSLPSIERWRVPWPANFAVDSRFANGELIVMRNHASLNEAIKRSGLPFRKLASELGVSAGHLHDLASGRRKPSLALAVALHQRFDLPLEGWSQETAA
jgi:DNA-binding XRE family transcriptional regulator